ncbi:MAG: hypothetical protein IKV20_02055 [Clostridia bacterium]|nr:hypothetical protein [Clostridia bacterium]
MREIFISAFTLSALASLLSLVTYREGDRVFRGAVYTVIISLLISPIYDAISSLDPLSGIGEVTGGVTEEFDGAIREAYEDAARTLIADAIGRDTSEVAVMAEGFSTTDIGCERLTVTLLGSAIYSDIDKIERISREDLRANEVRIRFG